MESVRKLAGTREGEGTAPRKQAEDWRNRRRNGRDASSTANEARQ